MPQFRVITTCTATIREEWRVEAYSKEEAEEAVRLGSAAAKFVMEQSEIGSESVRTVEDVLKIRD